ncbi:ATP11 protein-domain-containing protein [Zopfochytrium polystomum]|nr:ATP11 protein-domain-containing protein [Zopfochytrium polystomum]
MMTSARTAHSVSVAGAAVHRRVLALLPAAATARPRTTTVAAAAAATTMRWRNVKPFASFAGDHSSPYNNGFLQPLRSLTTGTSVSSEHLEKYSTKLLEKAKSKGYNTVEEFVAATAAEESAKRHATRAARQEAAKNEAAKEALSLKSPPSDSRREGLPADVKTLDNIVNVELLRSESPERIGQIWNEFHATKAGVSGAMDKQFFAKLRERGKKYPLFILPVPRNDGVEFFFMQISGHQIFYTPLLEYKLHRESARAHLVLNHYDDLGEEKDVVLMAGDILVETLTPEDARLLVYQTQLFYVTGTDRKQRLVETFHSNPAAFDFQAVIDEMEKLD